MRLVRRLHICSTPRGICRPMATACMPGQGWSKPCGYWRSSEFSYACKRGQGGTDGVGVDPEQAEAARPGKDQRQASGPGVRQPLAAEQAEHRRAAAPGGHIEFDAHVLADGHVAGDGAEAAVAAGSFYGVDFTGNIPSAMFLD